MRTKWALVAVALASVVIGGCSSGASVAIGDGKGSPFCNDVAAFRDQAAALETAATQDLASLRTQTNKSRDLLVALQKEANPADRVNNVAVKDDLQVTVDTYNQLSAGLAKADPADPSSATKALSDVQARQGLLLTKATDRLDTYTKKVCGISVTAASTTTVGPAPTASTPSTTASPAVGPVAGTPTTASGSPTTTTP